MFGRGGGFCEEFALTVIESEEAVITGCDELLLWIEG